MRLLLFALLLSCMLRAEAEPGRFLTVHPDGHKETWNSRPTFSDGTTILVWEIVDGDTDPSHYVSNGDGTSRHELPAPPPAPESQPNLPGFKAAIFADPDLTPAAKVNLLLFFPLIDQYVAQPANMIAAWGAIKAASFVWLTQDVIDKVEAYAAANHVTITP